MSKQFYVEWRIDIWADTPEEAAKKAREIQLDPNTYATVFNVHDDDTEHVIDLEELPK